MASVYILHSKTLDRFYTGSCSELSFRLEQHCNKDFRGSFTTKAQDWKIFLVINDLGYEQARSIETHIKRMKSKIYIENLEKYPEMVNRLILNYK